MSPIPINVLENSEINLLQRIDDNDSEASPSLEFIRGNPTYVTPGPNPIRIPHDEILNAMNGFSNMFLAHEISINDQFRLQNFMPKEDR